MTSHAAFVNNISHFISAYNSFHVLRHISDTQLILFQSRRQQGNSSTCFMTFIQSGSESKLTVAGKVTDILNFSLVSGFSSQG